MSNSFNYTIDNGDIVLSGMIDRFTVVYLTKGINLAKIPDEHVTLDFSRVDRVDTAGLAWLLKVLGQARQAGQVVALKGLPEQLLKLAKTSGVEQLLSGDE